MLAASKLVCFSQSLGRLDVAILNEDELELQGRKMQSALINLLTSPSHSLVADEDDWKLGTQIIDPLLHCCITIHPANLPQLEFRLSLTWRQ